LRPHNVDRPILSFVQNIVASEGCQRFTGGFKHVAEQHLGLLPDGVRILVQAGHTYYDFKHIVQQLAEGKVVGVLQTSHALAASDILSDIVASKAEWPPWNTQLVDHWTSGVTAVLSKSHLQTLKAFGDKYAPVVEAAGTWDFKKVAWIKQVKSEPERDAETRTVEGFITSAATTSRIITELASLEPRFFWAAEDLRAKIQLAKAALAADYAIYKEAALALSCMVLINCILTDTAIDHARKYVSDKLKIALADLPLLLQDKLKLIPTPGCKTESQPLAATTPKDEKLDTDAIIVKDESAKKKSVARKANPLLDATPTSFSALLKP
jgi:hypothetical protein